MVLYTWTNVSNTNCQFLIPCYHQNSLGFIVKHILFQHLEAENPPKRPKKEKASEKLKFGTSEVPSIQEEAQDLNPEAIIS